MAADVGAKLGVTGESSFNKAMREAAKNTKALGAELKLAEAQFKATGNAEELATQKDKILKEQLEQQKNAVKAATSALEELEKKGFEANSSKVLDWRAKLANAQQQVLELEGAIRENAAGAEQAGQAYDNLGEAMQNAAMDADTAKANIGSVSAEAGSAAEVLKGMGAKFSWDGLHDTLSGINDKIDAVIGKAVQMGKAIWEAGVDAAVWADDLITEAAQYDMSTETLQRWRYASRFVDTSVDTITGAWNTLDKKLQSISKDEATTLNSLGVAHLNTNGTLRSTEDVFWDIIGALGRMDSATERNRVAMALLGKSAKELNPLIKAGRDTWDEYANSAPVIGDEQLENLGAANDSIEDMNAQLEALKLDALAYLAPIIQQVAEAVSAASASMKEFLDSDEGQAALTSLQGAISDLLKDFTELDFGQILSDASEDITGIIEGFADLLKDKDSIISGLGAIGAGIIGMKVAEAATSVATLLSNLKLLGALSGGAAVTKGASTAAAASAMGSGAAAGIAKAASAAGPAVSMAYMGATWLMDRTEAGRTLRDTGSVGDAMAAVKQDVDNVISGIQENVSTFGSDWAGLWDAFKRDVLGLKDTVDAVKESAPAVSISDHDLGILRGIVDGDLAAYAFDDLDLSSIMQQLPGSMLAQVINRYGSAEYWYDESGTGDDAWGVEMAQEILDSFEAGMSDNRDQASEAVESTIQGAMDAGEAAMGNQPETMGENTAIGFGNGILSQIAFAVSAAQTMVDAVINTIIGGMDIGSPSKVMAKMGEYVGQGFAKGIDSTQGLVMDSAAALSGVVLRAPELPSAGAAGAGGSADSLAMIVSALSNMSVQIDGHDAGRVILPTLEELMTDQIMSRRFE